MKKQRSGSLGEMPWLIRGEGFKEREERRPGLARRRARGAGEFLVGNFDASRILVFRSVPMFR